MVPDNIFTFRFRYGGGEFNFHIGWFWIAVCAGLIWWAL